MKDNNTEMTDAQVDANFNDLVKSMAGIQAESRKIFGVTTDEVEAEADRIRKILKGLFQTKACGEFRVEGFDIKIEDGSSYYPVKVEVLLHHTRSESQIQALTRLNTLAGEVSDFFRKEAGIGNRVGMVYKIAN